MQFEIKGQTYYLNFLPEEGKLGLFAPTPRGVKRFLIVEDDPVDFDSVMLEPDTGNGLVN